MVGMYFKGVLYPNRVITYQPKTFDFVDIKSVITEHPKTSQKLFKTIGKGEKVGSNSSLYSDRKSEIFRMKKI